MQRNKMRIRTEYQRLFGRIINIICTISKPWGSILTSGIGSRRHRQQGGYRYAKYSSSYSSRRSHRGR